MVARDRVYCKKCRRLMAWHYVEASEKEMPRDSDEDGDTLTPIRMRVYQCSNPECGYIRSPKDGDYMEFTARIPKAHISTDPIIVEAEQVV